MRLSKEEVEHVGLLSRLELTPDEKERFTSELNQILDHIETLNELDTTDVEPTSHVIPLQNVFREDAAFPSLTPQTVLANAPDAAEECFRVPRIVE